MRRDLFEPEHDDFRESFRRFVEREIAPRFEDWERAGIVDRDAYASTGRHGFLGMAIPEEHGGAGVDDFRFNVVIGEEVQRAGVGGYGLGITLHNDICLPYFLTYCDEEQRERWLGGIASGELITAVAMTEPGIGSDLA
ncbi:MAG: acyl-CoA dehydrogenase, partial [Solirubrobacterales bacterium]|nr:acyl-CoA dehydrogenase [Solirubrobacterales bacterium]